jgi:hypothetical protein
MPSALRKILPMLLLPLAIQAEEILVINPGFEDISGESTFNEFTFGPLNGWSLYDPGNVTGGGAGTSYYLGTLQPTDLPSQPGAIQYFPGGAPEGTRVGIVYNIAATGGGGEWGFQQTLAATLQANTTYTLQVQVGNIASGTSVNGAVFNLDGFPTYRIDLLAGGEILKSDENSLVLGEGQFGLSTITFTTDSNPDRINQQLGIRLVSLNVVDPSFPAADLEVDFDDVRLTGVAVPEPGSIAFAAIAGLVLTARRRRT